MAEKKPTQQSTQNKKNPAQAPIKPAEPKKKHGCLLYLIIFFILTLAALAVATAAAEYFGIISLQNIKDEMGQKYQLQSYPVIGNYFSPVTTNFELTEQTEDVSETGEEKNEPLSAVSQPVPPVTAKANTLTTEDLLREEEIQAAEFAKRVGRLARLYSEMKPATAAAVLKEIDDDTVLAIFSRMEDDRVAKILALFEPARAAQLTEDMLRGRGM